MKVTIGEAAKFIRPRPKHLTLTSLATLYQDFANIFLGGKHQREHVFETDNGHAVQAFNHNFFHLVKLTHPERAKFKIAIEYDLILQHVDGFGSYAVDISRARALPSAFDALNDPDALIEGLRAEGSATHCFWKWYGGGPNPFTVTLTKQQQGYFVPVTSFSVNAGRLKKLCSAGMEIWKKAP